MRIFTKASFILLFLLASVGVKSQCTKFYDGFNSINLSGAWSTNSGYTWSGNNIFAAVGVYCLAATGNSAAYAGLSTTWTASQPSYISFWARTNDLSVNSGYVVIGNSTIAADNGIFHSHFTNSGKLQFMNSASFEMTVTDNTWYQVVAADINWTSRHLDIFVNGQLMFSNVAFPSATAPNADRVHLFSTGNATIFYDELRVIHTGTTLSSVLITKPSCAGQTNGAIDITPAGGTPGYTYSWTGGLTTQDISSLSAGNYSVTVTDGAACQFQDTYGVSDNIGGVTIPNYSFTPVTCHDGTDGAINIDVSGGQPPYSFLWCNSATTEDVTNLSPGNCDVTVTDANGCQAIQPFFISNPAAVTASAVITNESNLGLGNINLTPFGPFAGFTFVWSNGPTTEDITGLTAGTYIVTITNGPCTGIDTFVVDYVPISIDNQLGSTEVTVGPNPFNDFFAINFENGIREEVAVSVRDIQGREVWNLPRQLISGGRIEVEMDLPKGVYMLRISTETDAVNQRMLKD